MAFKKFKKDSRNPEGQAAGLRLHTHRMRSGETAEALCRRMNLSRSSFYKLECGSVIKLESVRKIATELDMTFEEVIQPLDELEKAEWLQYVGVPAEVLVKPRR